MKTTYLLTYPLISDIHALGKGTTFNSCKELTDSLPEGAAAYTVKDFIEASNRGDFDLRDSWLSYASVDKVVSADQANSNKPMVLKLDVDGDSQESAFMNATLSVMGDLAVSIAIQPPAQNCSLDQQGEIGEQIIKDLQALANKGYKIEVQLGPNELQSGTQDTQEHRKPFDIPSIYNEQEALAAYLSSQRDTQVRPELIKPIRIAGRTHTFKFGDMLYTVSSDRKDRQWEANFGFNGSVYGIAKKKPSIANEDTSSSSLNKTWEHRAIENIGKSHFDEMVALFKRYGRYHGPHQMNAYSAMYSHLKEEERITEPLESALHSLADHEIVAYFACFGLTLEEAISTLDKLDRNFSDRLCKFMG